MFERIFGLVLMVAVGLFALWEARRNQITGVGTMSYGPPVRRDHDPKGFRRGVWIKVACGAASIIAGILWFVRPW